MANFLAYADIGITELYREAFGSWKQAIEGTGIDMVVGESNVRYLAPLRFDEEFDLVLTVPRIGATSTTTEVVMERDGEIAAEVMLRHVAVDMETRRKASIPDSLRAGLQPYASTRGDP
jgi:acyl-CoA thioester hydrolase